MIGQNCCMILQCNVVYYGTCLCEGFMIYTYLYALVVEEVLGTACDCTAPGLL